MGELLKRAGQAHVNPELKEYLKVQGELIPPIAQSEAGPTKAIRTAKSELFPQVTADSTFEMSHIREARLKVVLKKAGLHSAMTTPLVAHGEILGAVWYAVSDSQRQFNSDDLALSEELSRRSPETRRHRSGLRCSLGALPANRLGSTVSQRPLRPRKAPIGPLGRIDPLIQKSALEGLVAKLAMAASLADVRDRQHGFG